MFAAATASTHPVTHLAFDPAGTTFAAAQPNYGVTLFDRATGAPTRTLPLPRVAGYGSLLFCAGGARVAVGSPRGVHVFDAATGDQVWGAAAPATGLAAAGASGLVAVVGSGLRDLRWAVRSDSPAWSTPRPLQSRAAVVAVSPCGRWGFGVYERVRPSLLDLGTGRVAAAVDHRYRSESRAGVAVTFAPDGGRFAVCDGTDVTVFDTPSRPDPEPDDEPEARSAVAPKPRALVEPVFTLEAEGERGRPWRPAVAFTPGGGGLLVRRPRNRVQWWDVAAAAAVGEWGWRLDSVLCLAVAPDGLTAVAGARFGKLVAWDLE